MCKIPQDQENIKFFQPTILHTEISFFVPLTESRNINYYLLAIAKIINWNGEFQPQSHGYQYMIGTSNDWWMEATESCQGQAAEIKIAYRYGSLKFMSCLADVLVYLLNSDKDIPEVGLCAAVSECLLFFPASQSSRDYLQRLARFFGYSDPHSAISVGTNFLLMFKKGRLWSIEVVEDDQEIKRIEVRTPIITQELMDKFREVLAVLLPYAKLNR